jgi:hypothetical protein
MLPEEFVEIAWEVANGSSKTNECRAVPAVVPGSERCHFQSEIVSRDALVDGALRRGRSVKG